MFADPGSRPIGSISTHEGLDALRLFLHWHSVAWHLAMHVRKWYGNAHDPASFINLIDQAKSLIQLVVHQCRSTNVPHAGFVSRNAWFSAF